MEFTLEAYNSLVEDIFKRFPSVQKDGFTAGAYKPGLDRMRAFDQALGHPSRQFKSIHIAGTNGKGSVANMLASALSSCGLKTGLFTSPHILDFRERIRMNGMISKEYVFNFLNQWLPWISENELSFFEITTGLAFKWFADSGAHVAVIETGLGGRLDSTNILEKPLLSLVTTIGLDHMAMLGDTVEKIAGEKAGIFKAGVPALVGEATSETAPVFEAKAAGFCPLFYAEKLEPTLWEKADDILQRMDLQAKIQRKNLRTVLAALDIVRPAIGPLDNDALVDGIVNTARNMEFHGRWERLSKAPLVIADIGHNAHALQHNFSQLSALMQTGKYSSLTIVYGIMADKDLSAIIPLMPQNAKYIFTAPSTPRALPAQKILEQFKGDAIALCPVAQAVQKALEIAGDDGLVYIGGSTFVVSEALPLFL